MKRYLLPLLFLSSLFGSPSETVAKEGHNYVAQHPNTVASDAFARLRVSEPLTLFDSKQLLDAGNLQWDTKLVANWGYELRRR